MNNRPYKRIKRIEPNGKIRWIEIDLYLHSSINSNYSSKASDDDDEEVNELISLVNPEDDINPRAFLNTIAEAIEHIGILMDNELSFELAVEEAIEKKKLKFNIPTNKEKFISILKNTFQ
jgi:hypothetical protein